MIQRPRARELLLEGRAKFVVTTDGKERVVFSSGTKSTAETVAKRYAGSTVREVPPKQKGGTAPAAK